MLFSSPCTLYGVATPSPGHCLGKMATKCWTYASRSCWMDKLICLKTLWGWVQLESWTCKIGSKIGMNIMKPVREAKTCWPKISLESSFAKFCQSVHHFWMPSLPFSSILNHSQPHWQGVSDPRRWKAPQQAHGHCRGIKIARLDHRSTRES